MSFPPRVPTGSDISVGTLTASGQIISTLVTGTAPLVIASTTNVANLNASSLSGKTFASPAAIGSGTPAAVTATALVATTVNGNTITTGTGVLTLGAGKTTTFDHTSTFTTTDAQTYTFPTTSATLARTDALQTFTGVQTFSSQPIIPGFSSSSTGATSLSGDTTQIQMSFRNTNTGTSAQTRVDWGNNAGASGFTIGLFGGNHATKPAWAEILNQAGAPLVLGANGNDVMYIASSGNVCLGVATSGSTAVSTMCLSNAATAPTNSVDRAHLYCADVSAGNATLALYQEMAPYAGIAVASTTKIPIIVNGTAYYILATTVA